GVLDGGSKKEYTSVVDGIVREGKLYSSNGNTGALEYTGSFKYDYDFDAHGLLTSEKHYENTAENSDWILYGSTTYIYTKDGNGNVLSWEVIPQKIGYATEKTEYTYDSQNRAVTAIVYSYDSETQQFVKGSSYERGFDNSGNQILATATYWENGEWTSQHIYEYAYDAAGRQTMYSYIDKYKIEGNLIEVYGYKYEYAFDNNGNETLFVNYNYDEATDEFVPRDKYESAYDTNNNLILEINYRYDAATQTLVPNYKDEYTYGDVWVEEVLDGSYNPLTIKEYMWTGDAWVLVMDGKYDWTFDNAGNPLTMSMSLKNGNEWVWYGTMTWYYSQHVITGIQAPAAAKGLRVRVSNGQLWIESAALKEGDAVQIFDIAGRKASEGSLRNGQSLPVSHLPKGVYIVKVGNQAVKFVKE
ncbi:MAG: T9SS type A sorting domain-containing protein, partial [Dysgonamonadaceae bacterium]|nr:T9SS type A sorting domain-containing protein [Dysgonamonadaceae bacterium]